MQFSFAELVAHAAKTRPLSAGTIVGSGTIANQDESQGASCLAERRTLETLRRRQAGHAVPEIRRHACASRCSTRAGASIFGAIEQASAGATG